MSVVYRSSVWKIEIVGISGLRLPVLGLWGVSSAYLLGVQPQDPRSVLGLWYNSTMYLISNGVVIKGIHVDVLACWTCAGMLDKVYEFKLWPGSLSSWQEVHVSVGFAKLLGQSDTIPGEGRGTVIDHHPSQGEKQYMYFTIIYVLAILIFVWVGLDFKCTPFQVVYPWWRACKRVFEDLS